MATLPAVHALDEAPGVVASVAQIDAWLAVARENDRFLYATRACLPVGSAGAARMRYLAAKSIVELTRPRSTLDPTLFNYQARRTSAPCVFTKPARSMLRANLVDAEAALTDALLPLLERAARFGRPCPTDKQLAERASLPLDVIQPGLSALSAAGLIRIEPVPSPTRRRVIIVTTGDRTGLIS